MSGTPGRAAARKGPAFGRSGSTCTSREWIVEGATCHTSGSESSRRVSSTQVSPDFCRFEDTVKKSFVAVFVVKDHVICRTIFFGGKHNSRVGVDL